MSTTIATSYRLANVDFPAAWRFVAFSTIMPYPKVAINLTASLEPLSYEVHTIIFNQFRKIEANQLTHICVFARVEKIINLLATIEIGVDSDCHFNFCYFPVT